MCPLIMCMELQHPCWVLQRGLVERVSYKLSHKSAVPFSLCPLRPEGKEEGVVLCFFIPVISAVVGRFVIICFCIKKKN